MVLDGKIITKLLKIFFYKLLLIKQGIFIVLKGSKKGWLFIPIVNILCSLQYESDEQEKSAYQEYDSDSDVPEELKRDYVDEQTGDAPVKR